MKAHHVATSAGVLACLLAAACSRGAYPPEQSNAASTEQRPKKQYSIEQFMNNELVGGASFSADESRILFSSNRTGIYNAYTVPVGGGNATPVTRSTTDTVRSVSFFPHDDRILITRDQGGNELNHLYVIGADGAEKDLTPGPKLKAEFGRWTPDGKAFYVMTNERDPRFFDIYRYDTDGYTRTLFFRNTSGDLPAAVSDDGKWVALSRLKTTNDSDIYLWNADTRKAVHVSPHQGQAQYQPAAFDAESAHLYYLTNDGGEFTALRRYALAGGGHEDVEKANWDIDSMEFSKKGTYRVTAINEDGRLAIHVKDAKTGAEVAMPSVPDGEIRGVTISDSEKSVAFYVSSNRSPANLYVHALGTRDARRLTDTLNKEVDPADLVDSQVVRFKSRDGIEVPSIFYKPHQSRPDHKAPALVYVHGGPGGQTMRGYSPTVQFLVNHGYVVLGINNRGSSGYGKTFFAADDRKHGREPLWDCVDGKQYLASLPYVDPQRIGIMGGSYGGYMVLAALAFQPDVFGVGIDLFGVSNWLRTLESIPSWWEAERKALYAEIGDPVKDKAMLQEVSPLFHADAIRKPLMVLQGVNDPRVLKAESDEIVSAVKKNNVPVEYVLFPDEGHGFTKKKNQIEGYGKVLAFLDKYLKGTAATN
jgi:dipeptidyl aminopeptidase/acylaminoacyl peptidase